MICSKCNGTGEELNHAQIGAGVRTQRLAAGVSLRKLARVIGLSHSYLCQLEQGKRQWRSGLIKSYERKIARLSANKNQTQE